MYNINLILNENYENIAIWLFNFYVPAWVCTTTTLDLTTDTESPQ